MRVPFAQVFATNADGTVAPKVPVRLGGQDRGPGSEFGARVRIGSAAHMPDFAALRGRDLEVVFDGRAYVILHAYSAPPRHAPLPWNRG